jgi:transposase
MPPSAVLFCEDETIVRLFPLLRRAWSLSGQQATVGVTGHNAKRALIGAINLRSGHRVVMCCKGMNGGSFRDFLRLLRHRYAGRPIWMLLDGSSLHTAAKSLALAQELDIHFVWLPRQCPELNAMDHLFKEVKAHVSANYQFEDIDQHLARAEHYILELTNKAALKKAGILSRNFWIKKLL